MCIYEYCGRFRFWGCLRKSHLEYTVDISSKKLRCNLFHILLLIYEVWYHHEKTLIDTIKATLTEKEAQSNRRKQNVVGYKFEDFYVFNANLALGLKRKIRVLRFILSRRTRLNNAYFSIWCFVCVTIVSCSLDSRVSMSWKFVYALNRRRQRKSFRAYVK